jgi:lipoyl-dependent peroxiredoxin
MPKERIMSELKAPAVSLLDRYSGSDIMPLYKTKVTVGGGVAGHGRASGVARSDDGNLDIELRLPKALGGPAMGPILSNSLPPGLQDVFMARSV